MAASAMKLIKGVYRVYWDKFFIIAINKYIKNSYMAEWCLSDAAMQYLLSWRFLLCIWI